MEVIRDQAFPDRNNELNNLRKNKQHLDFQLKTKAGESIGVHKVILVASCFTIKGLLENRPDVNEFNLYIDISLDTLEKLVEYLYTGRVALTVRNAEILYESSVKLQVTGLLGLQKIIIDYMIRKIDLNFFLEFWRFGVRNKIEDLQAECTEFFVSNFEKCFDAEIRRLEAYELNKIISYGRLKMNPEILYLKISEWIKKDIPKRKYLLKNLIENIDFSEFKMEFVKSTMTEDRKFFDYEPFSSKVVNLICSRKQGVNIKFEDVYLVTSSEISKLDFDNKKIINNYKMNWHTNEVYSVVTNSSKDILMSGGHGDKVLVYKSFKMISPFSNRIKELEPMKVVRTNHRMCSINDQIYACGGYTSFTKCESYNLERANWFDEPSLNGGRHSFGLIGTGNCLYAIGGDGCSTERFDVRQKNWKIILKSEDLSFRLKSLHFNSRIYCINSRGSGKIFDIRTNKISGTIAAANPSFSDDMWQEFDIIEYNSSIYGIFPGACTQKVYKYEYQDDKWIDLNISLESYGETIDLVVMSEY